MRLALLLLLTPAVASSAALPESRSLTNTSHSPNAVLRGVDLDAVHWTSGFWAQRFDIARRATLPTMWKVINNPENGASLATFKIAAGMEQSNTYATPYSDGDCYKWVESAAHIYAITRDAGLDRQMDEAIAIIAKAQASDGYISTPLQARKRARWENLNNHELYNMGHLMTAACIHYRATGKDSFLRVARKAADYLYGVFSPRPAALAHFCFNPSQIMGLVELYRTTGEPKYLELARIFVEMRGSKPGGTAQNQDRTPLRKETEAVGHAVTATYLYAGATDVLAETKDEPLRAAIGRIWDNLTQRKLYVTGAVGALHKGLTEQNDSIHESFGLPYELPNRNAYNETCANIGNAMWNWRLLTLTGDARYTDLVERVFYNSMLSGISLKGTEFYYTNVLRREVGQPLLWNDTAERWPDTAGRHVPNKPYSPAFCCPPNALRTIASMHEYAYSLSDGALWVNLYGANRLRTHWPDGGPLEVSEETDYPWDGAIRLTIGPGTSGDFAIRLRIPGWSEKAAIRVNGKPVSATDPATYTEIRRVWRPGDRIELDLPMPVRLLESRPQLEETRNQVAVMRGPLVYCVESPDLPAGTTIHDVGLPADARIASRLDKNLLGGVVVLDTEARRIGRGDWGDALYRVWKPQPRATVRLKMIPYYAWSNRGLSSMTVWLPLAAN